MTFQINQFAIQRQKGNLTTAPDWNVIACKIVSTQVGELTYGDAVVIKGSAAGQTTVEKAAAATDDIFGFVVYSIRKNTWVAGDYINIAFNDAVMFMEASASILSGAPVQFDPSTKKIATQSAGNTTIGISIQKAASDGDLIPVLIKTPNVAPNISTSYTPGTVTASDLVCVDANKDITDFRNVTITGSFIIGSASMNEVDLEKLDGITNGTQAASKCVVADANVNTGISKITELHIGASGSEVQVNSTPAELNMLDLSAQTETIAAAGAASVVKRISKLALVGAGAITLAAPDATMLGTVKVIEMTTDNGDVTLSLANVVGGTAATTCTWSAVNQALVLVGGTNKWYVVAEAGVALT